MASKLLWLQNENNDIDGINYYSCWQQPATTPISLLAWSQFLEVLLTQVATLTPFRPTAIGLRCFDLLGAVCCTNT